MVVGYYPKTIAEALDIRKQHNDGVLVAGGSDLMVVKKIEGNAIFINQIDEIQNIELDDKEEVLRIGAGVTYSQMLASELVPNVLKQAVELIASPAIRNVGTMVGNVCNASPAGDTLPVLYALDAVIVKAKKNIDGDIEYSREPISSFIVGVRKITLELDEMVTAIELPTKIYESMNVVNYEKVGARDAEAISKASFVGLSKIENGKIIDWRVAFGSVGITVIRNLQLEDKVKNLSLEELKEKKDSILKEYDELIHPIDDQRSTAVYRKKVCLNLLGEFIDNILN